MAYVKAGQELASRWGQNLYSRKFSPDRRLYSFREALNFVRARGQIMADVNWWVYLPEPPVLPVRPLTPEDRRGLERTLPF